MYFIHLLPLYMSPWLSGAKNMLTIGAKLTVHMAPVAGAWLMNPDTVKANVPLLVPG